MTGILAFFLMMSILTLILGKGHLYIKTWFMGLMCISLLKMQGKIKDAFANNTTIIWTLCIFGLWLLTRKTYKTYYEKQVESKEEKGRIMEARVYIRLENLNKKIFHKKGRLLRNVYIPKGDGTYTEIDVLWITPKGIAVLECKNFKGWIFGTDTDEVWTQVLLSTGYDSEKNHFYNPIKQNENHIKYLKENLKEMTQYYSYIVFADEAKFKEVKLTTDPKECSLRWVGNEGLLEETLKRNFKQKDESLADSQIIEIYEKLKPYTEISEEERQKHIEQISNNKY